MLNHVNQGVIKVYNLYRCDKEKQAALERWERKLKWIIGEKQARNVVRINSGRKKGVTS